MFSDRLAAQIAKTATAAGINPAGMLAIVEVETSGQPLEADGRTPNFLFERHVFRRELVARRPDMVRIAERAGLALKAWTPATQYKDQGNSTSRLALLARAKGIDEECALRSCSWGLPQVMGNECAEIGFPSAMVLVDFMTHGGVQAHLDVMVKLIKAKRLVSAIDGGEWATVALRYNGKGYRKNNYDTKLAAAFKKWSRKLATLEAVAAAPPPPESLLDRDEVTAVQRKLRELGYHEVGSPDGRWGSKTIGAISAFQAHEGLPHDGHYTNETRDALFEAEPRPVSDARAETSLDDLRESGSETVAGADAGTNVGFAKVLTGGTILSGGAIEATLGKAQDAADKVGQVKGIWSSIHDMLLPVLGSPPVMIFAALAVAAGLGVVYYFHKVKLARLSDHRTGIHAGVML